MSKAKLKRMEGGDRRKVLMVEIDTDVRNEDFGQLRDRELSCSGVGRIGTVVSVRGVSYGDDLARAEKAGRAKAKRR